MSLSIRKITFYDSSTSTTQNEYENSTGCEFNNQFVIFQKIY